MILAHDVHGEGPALLLVHGMSLDRRMWDPNLPALSERYTVVRCDLRGFGASAPPDGPYSHAEDLHALLRHLGIERAAVVGLSLGGGIALELTLAHPQAVGALALVGTDLPGVPIRDATFLDTLGAVRALAAAGDHDAACAAWLATPLFARSQPAAADRLAEIVGDYAQWHWRNPNPHVALDPPAGLRGGEVTVPTLVLRGEREVPDIIDNCERMARDVPDARSVVLPDAGHIANMDAPAAFDAALLEFLAAAAG